MRQVSISEAKNRLCELIDGLASGPVTITNRGKVVAQLTPPARKSGDEREADLIRRGKLLPPRRTSTREQRRATLAEPGVKLPEGTRSVIEYLIAERREGR